MLKKIFYHNFDRHLKGEETHMKSLPIPAFCAVYFMTLSVLTQGMLDVWIKILSFTPVISSMPWRVNFLFLTAISVLMGYQTLAGIKRRELDVTRNSVQIGLLVEIALVIGDIIFIREYRDIIPEALFLRSPFIFFTSINILILIYLIWKLDLLRDKYGNWQFF